MKLNEYDFYVFDCDGVILDSNRIKTLAFEKALSGENKKQVEEFIEYHKRNGGITRQNKFLYFFSNIKHDIDESKVSEALDRFASICEEELVRAELVPGVLDFLKTKKARSFVVTGGNEKEVKSILDKKSLSKYFDSILGNPNSKSLNMEKLSSKGLFQGKGVYFGDALLDYQLAKKHNLDFVYISGYSEWEGGIEYCRDRGAHVYQDFLSLENWQ